MRYAITALTLWGLTGLAFVGLTQMRQHNTEAPPTPVTGNQLQTQVQTPEHRVTLTATVTGITPKRTGLTLLDLEAQDGTPLKLMIPPTLQLKLPRTGQQVQVQAQQVDQTLLSLNDSNNLTILPPRHTNPHHQTPTIQWPMAQAEPDQPFTTTGMFNITSRSNSGTIHGFLTRDQDLVANCVLPHQVAPANLINHEPVSVTGYLTPDKTLIVQQIDPLGVDPD